MKTKLGRPKLPKEKAKSSVIRARVSAGEREKMEKAAGLATQSLTDWVRNTLHKAAS